MGGWYEREDRCKMGEGEWEEGWRLVKRREGGGRLDDCWRGVGWREGGGREEGGEEGIVGGRKGREGEVRQGG